MGVQWNSWSQEHSAVGNNSTRWSRHIYLFFFQCKLRLMTSKIWKVNAIQLDIEDTGFPISYIEYMKNTRHYETSKKWNASNTWKINEFVLLSLILCSSMWDIEDIENTSLAEKVSCSAFLFLFHYHVFNVLFINTRNRRRSHKTVFRRHRSDERLNPSEMDARKFDKKQKCCVAGGRNVLLQSSFRNWAARCGIRSRSAWCAQANDVSLV